MTRMELTCEHLDSWLLEVAERHDGVSLLRAQVLGAMPRVTVLMLSQPRGRSSIVIGGLSAAQLDAVAAPFLTMTHGGRTALHHMLAGFTEVSATWAGVIVLCTGERKCLCPVWCVLILQHVVCCRQDSCMTFGFQPVARALGSKTCTTLLATLTKTISVRHNCRAMGTSSVARSLLPMLLRSAEVPSLCALRQQVSL